MALAFSVVGVSLSAVPVYAQATLLVPSQFTTIQSAVDSAQPGDQIHILPGTYTEQVTINKDVELTGSGVDSTFIKAPQRSQEDRLVTPPLLTSTVARQPRCPGSQLLVLGLEPVLVAPCFQEFRSREERRSS
jgi:pectin methylesterase-like acyl-CoA thioesterase